MRDSKNDVKHEQNKSKIPKNQTQSKIVHKIPPQLKRLRAKLQDSKTWYRAIFDNSNDAIFLIEADRFIDCNPKTLEMFGCTKEQIIDQTPYDRFSPKLQPDNQSSKEKALEKIRLALEGQPQSFEWRHLRYDGTPFEVEVSLNRVEFSGHFYLLSSVRDITKQKHTYIQYDMILKTATDGFCILDAHGRILEVNDAYCEMVDYSREELLSMNLVDVEALESAERVKKHIQKLMNSGSQKFETRHRRKDGKFIDLEVSANNLKLDGHRLFAFFRDITERKKAEVDVRQERDKAQKYLDVAGVMFVALDKEGVVTLINQKGCQILSCDEKNIFGKNWFDNFLPKEVGKKAKHIFEKLMIGELESVEYYENPVLTKSGEERQIAWHNSLLKNEDGRIVGTLSSGEDITERKKADKELLRARQDWENIFQAIGQPSFILDPQHKIITANRATVKKAGIALEQLKGKQCSELLHGKERPPKECPMEKMQCSGCAETVEMEIEAFGGIFLVSCTPVCDTKGRIEKVIHIATDITDRKEAERKLREHEEQLKSLASELSFAEERERRRIAAGIHDDIAQRLALAKLELQLIQNTISDSNVILSLKNQCGTIDLIMEDIRSLIFELSNPLLYEIGLKAAIESFLMEQIQEKCGIKCKFISQGSQINLDEDIRIVLYQGVRELLTNIVKHANASRAEVRIVKSNTQISIVIEDNGIGLNLSKLGSPERDKGGFGLFNIRERLEYLGGNLNIKSTPNKGTCVTMSIPLKLKTATQQTEILP